MEYELGHFQELKLTSCFRGDEFGVSSVVFDPQEDLLWAATYGVSIISMLLRISIEHEGRILRVACCLHPSSNTP